MLLAPKTRIAILAGGPAREYQSSLESALVTQEVLQLSDAYRSQVEVVELGNDLLEKELEKIKNEYHAIVSMIRGVHAEGGMLFAKLEEREIPYSGTRSLPTALRANQIALSKILKEKNIEFLTPVLATEPEWKVKPISVLNQLRQYHLPPFLIRPWGGGVDEYKVAKTMVNAIEILDRVIPKWKKVFIETIQPKSRGFICCAIDHGWPDTAFALLPIEVYPYTHDVKEHSSSIPEWMMKRMRKWAVAIHENISCRGFSATEYLVNEKNKIRVIGVRTIPSLIENGVVLQALKHSHLSVPAFLKKYIQTSSYDKRQSH